MTPLREQLGPCAMCLPDLSLCAFPLLILICILSLQQNVAVTITAYNRVLSPSKEKLNLSVVWGSP